MDGFFHGKSYFNDFKWMILGYPHDLGDIPLKLMTEQCQFVTQAPCTVDGCQITTKRMVETL